MSRGRHRTDAYIVTNGQHNAVDIFAEASTHSWIDRPALARQAELHDHNPHQPGALPKSETR